jgi:putative mycofactocin binding protein MftB
MISAPNLKDFSKMVSDRYMKETRYKLAQGTQVREEDFGLLFYTMAGPRLYFLSSGDLITADFFEERLPLEEWVERHVGQNITKKTSIFELNESLRRLSEKGVIHEY